ncbi:hypothetical protein M885DRAFT_579984 [Pelagophyceae sp. CCMP2097]|nr:hypothetical protein M885DRAFT_579984 [Pelagophyceae sp. CCMP2097]
MLWASPGGRDARAPAREPKSPSPYYTRLLHDDDAASRIEGRDDERSAAAADADAAAGAGADADAGADDEKRVVVYEAAAARVTPTASPTADPDTADGQRTQEKQPRDDGLKQQRDEDALARRLRLDDEPGDGTDIDKRLKALQAFLKDAKAKPLL